jgi:hypothetical protein
MEKENLRKPMFTGRKRLDHLAKKILRQLQMSQYADRIAGTFSIGESCRG